MKKPEKPPFSGFGDINAVLPIMQNIEKYIKTLELDREHPYWDTIKYKAKELGIDPLHAWSIIKLDRAKNVKHLIICKSPFLQLKYNVTDPILRRLHEFDLYMGGILDGGSIIPSEDKKRYLISSIMEEAIASSQLEGAVATREDAKEMLRTKRKPRDMSEEMILNNYLTIQYLFEQKKKPLSKELILEIHRIISKNTLGDPDDEGAFRTNNNINVVDGVTGEIFYTPPDHIHIESMIKDLCDFANAVDEKEFIHPIVKAIVLHFLIGYIHPFNDGNGRTARAIFYWYLISKEYWLIEYLSISRILIKSSSQYARAYLYTEYDENDVTYFIDYNLKSIELALKSLRDYIDRKIQDKRTLFELVKNANLNDRQSQIVSLFVNDNQKVVSIKEIQGRFDVVYQTARTDLMGLVELGYLTQKQVGKKMLFFKSDGFDNIIKHMGRK